MRALLALMIGAATTALLFPTHSVTGCNGDCETRNISVLVEYPGENGAIGMGVAVAAGLLVGAVVFYIAGLVRREK